MDTLNFCSSVTVGGKTIREMFSDPGDDVFKVATDITKTFAGGIYRIVIVVGVIFIILAFASVGFAFLWGNSKERMSAKAKLASVIIAAALLPCGLVIIGRGGAISEEIAGTIMTDTNEVYQKQAETMTFPDNQTKFEYVITLYDGEYRYGPMVSYLVRYKIPYYMGQWISILGDRYEGY